VRDDGPGIPPHLVEKVFQPFFSTKEQGTGLGLSIAQRIIGEHHGSLEVESIDGQGAVFTITLPAKESVMSTILIVDDDDQLRKSFHKLLVEEGYTVASAASGEDGLRNIQKSMPDLVVLDMRLPGMNGLETFRAIHRLEPKLPVIIMTAFGTTEHAIEATSSGRSTTC